MHILVLAGFGLAYGLFSTDRDLPLEPYEPPPYSHGTEFDCKIAVPKYGADAVWYGRFSGRTFDDGPNMKQLSDTACFQTQAQCRAWLGYWNGKVFGEAFQSSCQLGYPG